MADYNLGTAHGEIKITNDRRATDQARKAYETLRDDLKKLDDTLKRLNASLDDNTKAMGRHGNSAHAAATGVDRLSSSHRNLDRNVSSSGLALRAFAVTARNSASISKSLAYNVADVGKKFAGLNKVSFKSEDMVRNLASLGFMINTARIKTAGFRKTVSTTNKVLAQLSVWSTQGAKALSSHAHTTAFAAGQAGKLTTRLHDQAKAWQLISTRIDKQKTQLAWYRSALNGVTNATRATGRGLTNLAYSVGGVKKALAELSPAQMQILQIARTIVILGGAVEALKRKLAPIGRAIASGIVAGFQKLPAVWSSLLSKAMALAEGIRRGAGRALEAFLSMLILRFGNLGAIIGGSSILAVRWAKNWVRTGFAARGVAAAIGLIGPQLASAGRGMGLFTKTWITFGATALGIANRQAPVLARLIDRSNLLQRAFKKNTTAIAGMSGGIVRMALGVTQAITGFAMVKRGLNGLRVFLNLVALGFQAVNLAGFALVGLGTVFFTIGNAARQLSGIVAALPGAISALAVAGGVAAVGLKGLFTAIKAGAGDVDKFEEATKNLPPALKGIAREVQNLKGPFRDIKNSIQTEMFKGLDGQIKVLTNNYLPLLRNGTKAIAQDMNRFSDGFAKHLADPASIQAMNRLFTASGQIVTNLGLAFRPALDGMRELGTAGAETLARLSMGASNVTSGFSIWAKQFADSGRLDEVIRGSLQGFSQLGSTIRNLAGIAGDFFRAIGSRGAVSLARMAEATDRWRESFSKTLDGGGGISKFIDHIQRMGQYTKVAFGRIKSIVSSVFDSLGDKLEAISESINSGFVVGVTKAVQAIGLLAKIMANIPGIDTFLALAVAMSALHKVIRFAWILFGKLIGVMVGLVTGFMGLTRTVVAYVATVNAGTASSGLMATALQRLGVTAGFVQAAMGVLGVALAAVAILWMGYKNEQAKVEARQNRLAENTEKAAEAQRRFGDALEETQGRMSTKALDAMTEATAAYIDSAKQVDDYQQGITHSMGSQIDTLLGGLQMVASFGTITSKLESDFKRSQNADFGQELKDALDKTGLTDGQLSKAITGTEDDMNRFYKTMRKAGVELQVNYEPGTENPIGRFANEISDARQLVVEAQEAMKNSAPGFMELTSAMDVLGDASSSTADKLSAVDAAMRAMGLLKTDGAQAIKDSADAVKELGDNMSQITMVDSVGEKLFLPSGEMNQFSQGFQTLLPIATNMYQALKNTAAAGGDLDKVWQQQVGALRQLQQQTGMSEAQFQNMLSTFGLMPDQIRLLLSLEGVPEAERDIIALSGYIKAMKKDQTLTFYSDTDEAVARINDLAGVTAKAKEAGNGFKISVTVTDPAAVKGDLDELISQIQEANPQLKLKTVTEMSPDELARLRQDIDDSAKTGKPITLPTQLGDPAAPKSSPKTGPTTETKPDKTAPTVDTPSTKTTTIKVVAPGVDGTIAHIKTALEGIPREKPVTLKVFSPGVDGTINSLKTALAGLKDKSITLKVFSPGVDGTIGNLRNLLNGLKDKTVTIKVDAAGVSEAIGSIVTALEGINEAANGAAESIEGAMRRAITAIDSVIPAINRVVTALNDASSGAFNSGAALGEGFAQGIRSKIDEVNSAANELATAAARPLPSSPAKEGPFSGRGWTPFRGRSLAEGFAQGIQSGASNAKSVSLDMAQAVSSALDKARVALGMQRTFFDANNTPGIGGKKYYRDPNISDRDLAKARKEKADQDAQQAKDDAWRRAHGRDTSDSSGSTGNSNSANSQKVDDFVKSLDNAQYQMGGFSNALLDCSGFVSAVANVATGRDPFSERANTTNLAPFLTARGFKQGKGGSGDLTIAWWDNGGGQNGHAALTTGSGLNAESTTGGVRFGNGAAGARSNNGQFANFMYLPLGGKDSKNLEKVSDSSEATKKNTKDSASATEKTIPLIKNADGTYSSSNAEWNKLIQRESGGNFKVVQQIQDANSGGNEASGGFQIAKGTWAANGGKEFAETAAEATPEQQAIVAARIFQKSGAQPWGNRENEALLRAGLVDGSTKTGSRSSSSDSGREWGKESLAEARKQNEKLDEAVKTLQDQNASVPEVIRALQEVDNTIKSTEDPDLRDELKGIRDATMQDRGIAEYDPKAGKSEDPIMDTVGMLQNILGLYRTIEQGFEAAKATLELLIRGFENTKDVNTFIDGLQSISQAVSSVMSTVSSMVDIAASLAAAAGSAIPGIGQVSGIISGITGGIGNVNAVVDLIQEAWSIGSRFAGYALSWLAGGGNGPIQGDVKALLDTNDQTLKTWSSDNALDKNVFELDPYNKIPNNGNLGAKNEYNIYANPNAPASEIVNELGYAVRVSGNGAFEE